VVPREGNIPLVPKGMRGFSFENYLVWGDSIEITVKIEGILT
jgi:hypothetical protein